MLNNSSKIAPFSDDFPMTKKIFDIDLIIQKAEVVAPIFLREI